MAGVQVTGFSELSLDELRARLNNVDADLGSAMVEISEALLQSTQERAAKEVAPDGTPWTPLAESTKLQKARQSLSINKILHGESGNLFGTLFPFAGALEAGVSTGPGSSQYAAAHQFGSQFGGSLPRAPRLPAGSRGKLGAITSVSKRRQIPARPYLGISRDDQAEVIDILRFYLFTTPL